MYYLYLLCLWSFIYFNGLKYTKYPSYINSSIHTSMLLLMLTLSNDNIKYVIPWSKSYFLFDSLVSSYYVTKPLIVNGYNSIIKNPSRIKYEWSHIGYLIHHVMAIHILQTSDSFKHTELYSGFRDLYYYLECSNVFLYITYFVFQAYGKNNYLSLSALVMEIVGYGYIRTFLLMNYIRQYWYLMNITTKSFSIILYLLGVIWTNKLFLQLKHMLGNVQDLFF